MPTRIKRYEEKLDNLDSLLSRIELEMGPQAQLEAREFRRNGMLGLGGQRMVEIIATLTLEEEHGDVLQNSARKPAPFLPRETGENIATEEDKAPDETVDLARDSVQIGSRSLTSTVGFNAADMAETESARRLREAFGRQDNGQDEVVPPSITAAEAVEDRAMRTEMNELRSSLGEIRSMLAGVASRQQQAAPAEVPAESELARLENTFRIQRENLRQETAEPPSVPQAADPQLEALREGLLLQEPDCSVFRRMLAWNISAVDCLELIGSARTRVDADCSETDLHQAVRHEICRGILLKGGIRLSSEQRKVVALVGPTGVGKTTTIAKLAAQAVFEQGHRVAVISMDNYRIAAVEQMRSYAEIMGLRFEVVFSPQEYLATLEDLRDFDLVLVDTAGRSPACAGQIAEGAEMFAGSRPDEVHLVVAAGTLAHDMQQILDSFAVLGYDQLIVSKLDETRSLGGLHNLSRLSSLPVSYFTVGQSVPEDIRAAEPEFVSELNSLEVEQS